MGTSHLEKGVMWSGGSPLPGLLGCRQRRELSRFTLLAIQYRSVTLSYSTAGCPTCRRHRSRHWVHLLLQTLSLAAPQAGCGHLPTLKALVASRF